MSDDGVRDPYQLRILDAAERLFYSHGVQQVGMDRLCTEAEVSLKRLYREFPSKDQLLEAYLRRRDEQWLDALRAAVGTDRSAAERVVAVFDWLAGWFAEPGFRGCAFTNSFGELGGSSEMVASIARMHKSAFRALFADLGSEVIAESTRQPPGSPGLDTGALADQLYLLAEGAITATALTGDVGFARAAKAAAATLLDQLAARPPDARIRPRASRSFPGVGAMARRVGRRLVRVRLPRRPVGGGARRSTRMIRI